MDDRSNKGTYRSRQRLPLACTLSGPELAGRRGELEELFQECLRTEELVDGYEFYFPGSGEVAFKLTQLIVFERQCCPFLNFELVFEPGGGEIRLRVRGSEGVKDVVAQTFAGRTG